MKQHLHFKKNILFFFTLFFLLINGQAEAQWKTLVTSPENVSITYDESLVIDSQDNAYFILENNAETISKVIKFDGNTQTELGAEGFAAKTDYTSIAIDNNDVIYVAYNDLTLNSSTTVKKFDGTNWVLVGTAGFSSPNSTNQSLEIDNNGTPYVLFVDGNSQKSTVMKFDGTNWINVGNVVNTATAGDLTINRLKINSNNIPYVMHNDMGLGINISVKKFDGTNWVNVGSPSFAEIGLQSSSFAISPNDVPYVAFQDFMQSNRISVMKFDGINWVNVGNAGFTTNAGNSPSIVVGQNEIPYVSYKDEVSSKANVMKFDNSVWVHVGSPDIGTPVTDLHNLAVSSSDKLYLLFHNSLYNFYATLMSFEISSAPQLTIQTNDQEIYDSQTFNIGAVDYTCTANTITKTFTIRNAGFSNLVLNGSPSIQIFGSSDFTVTQVRSNTIPSFETQTFTVKFRPTQAATQTATISIRSNDPTNSPYTFDLVGSGVYATPSPVTRIIASNTSSFSGFGISVAMWNNYMVVGSPDKQEAIVYKHNGASWQEEAVLKGPNNLPLGNTTDFGYAVDIYDDYIVVGGWRDTYKGAAYVFHKEGNTWVQQARLTASDRQVDDYFGQSVAIDQEYIIIGSYGEDTAGDAAGAAYIYKREGTVWSEQTKLASNDLNVSDLFGHTVDIQDDWAIVGALRQQTNSPDEGAVYIFHRNENTWTQVEKLQPNDVSLGMNFGQSISISGNQLAIGTDRDDNLKGAVYIYEFNGINWTEQKKITASDAISDDYFGTYFGTSLSLYGNYLLVGTPLESSINSSSGAAYFFKKEGNNWSEIAKIKASPAQFDELFGASVGLSANKLAIGAGGYRSTNGIPIGAIYVSEFGGSKIEVTGNNNYILNGSSYTTISTGTDFGIADACTTGSITREFTITNKGCTTINLTGTPLISINGSSDFVVNNFTTTSITANGSATFSVTYTPNIIGVQNATISIKNSDADNSLYTFAIQALKKDDNQAAFEAIILGESERISCQNSVSLEAQSVSNATSYTWLKDGVEVGNGINYQATLSGNYQVRIKKENCLVTSESVTVLLNYAPLSEIQQQNNISFCGSGILNITSSTLQSNSNANYEWLFNNNVIGTETELRVTQSGNYTLRATRYGCISETTITISITDSNLPSELILQSSGTTLCTNVDLILTTESISNVKYEWFRNDSLIISNGTNELTIDTAGKYRVKISLNGCELISNEIEIFQIPTPYLNTSETTIFIEQDVDNQNIASISWKLDDDVITEFDAQITITPKKSGSYSAVVTYQSGCIRQTEAISFVVPEGNDNQPNDWVIYPNPSTDGNFEIEFDFPLSEDIEVTVFDAIGRTIWIQPFQKGSNKQSFYLNKMAQGMYIIKTYSNNQTSIKQLIIK